MSYKVRKCFLVEIFSRVQSITVYQISQQVGISPQYGSLVKEGLNVPHPCLYPKFEECCNQVSGEVVEPSGKPQSSTS